MKRTISCMAAALLLAGTASAQYDTGGVVMDPSTVTAFDMFNLSQTQFSFGTARAAAMAGAFTSLGADLSSMSINPAGLGMFQHNYISVSPMMTFNNTRTSAGAFERTNGSRFALSNVGMSLKLRESATGVTAINFGFGYNRIADFNYTYSLSSQGQNASIADAFARMLRGSGMDSGYIGGDDFYWGDVDPALWGSTLGYLCGLTSDASGTWERDMIGQGASVDQFSTVSSRGSVGEYLLSLGMNINNKFYIGASIGIQDVMMRRDIYYGEGYSYSSDPGMNYRMEYFNYDQWTRLSGAGINFKFGMIYRPIEGLRIGVAVHTPTFYSLTYKYGGGMTSQVKAENNVDGYEVDSNGYINPPFSEATATLVDDGQYSWEFTSPTRLLFGASYTFGFGVISVDYERDWYNGMRVSNSPYGRGLYDEFVRNNFKGSNTLRVGAEFKVLPQIALRAGYGMWGSALRDNSAVYSSPMIYRTDYVGAGAGFYINNYFYIDLAYQYRNDKLTDYTTFYCYNDTEDFASPTYRSSIQRHSVILTLGFRF